MKKYANWLLFVLFVLSAGLCVWLLCNHFDYRMFLVLPALPCFLLQLWLCRVTDSTVLQGTLGAMLTLFVFFCALSLWEDGLNDWTILFVLPLISPIVGTGLGWYVGLRGQNRPE